MLYQAHDMNEPFGREIEYQSKIIAATYKNLSQWRVAMPEGYDRVEKLILAEKDLSTQRQIVANTFQQFALAWVTAHPPEKKK